MAQSFLAFLCLFIGPNLSFAVTCEGEAQIIAKVSEHKTDSQTYCTAYIDSRSIAHYSESGVCPLPLEVVLHQGVQYALTNGCNVRGGDSINGVLVMRNGQIEIEN